jgi:glycosyltransferase involved in cell wall biosynthesis
LVSIIIPTFNRGNLIAETLNSVLEQAYANLEVLVVDDGSSDNTKEIVEGFRKTNSRVYYFERPTHLPKGANACRNYGLTKSKGKYVKWLDSDDLLLKDCLEKQVQAIELENADLCICNTKVFPTEFNLELYMDLPDWSLIRSLPNIDNFVLKGIKWHTAAGLWRKDWFLNQSPFDEELQNSQEWLMHLQALCRGPKIVAVSETLCLARKHDDNMSHRKNKRGKYYYNECLARLKALKSLKKSDIKTPLVYRKLKKQFYWYHIFVLYKGSPLLWLRLLIYYPKIVIT